MKKVLCGLIFLALMMVPVIGQEEVVVEETIIEEVVASEVVETEEVEEVAVSEEEVAVVEEIVPEPPKMYKVRIEVYERMKKSYISVGNLSLRDGYFQWAHDGNGYEIVMYPVLSETEKFDRIKSANKRLYARSFWTIDEAIYEVSTKNSEFWRLIRRKEVIDVLVKRLESYR
jgi:hypothetical protein